MNYIRSFLKYPGGKYRLLDDIFKYTDSNKTRFIDVFCGSGVVGINSNFSEIILNDINIDIINIFDVLKKSSNSFIKDLSLLFVESNNNEKIYNELRDEFNSVDISIYRKALLTIYLNRHCFNGVVRYNSSKKFNVPYGKIEKPYFPYRELLNFTKYLPFCEIQNRSYEDILLDCNKNDCVYCDPPYLQSDEMNSIFSTYSGDTFLLDDHIKMINIIENIRSNGSRIIISNHDTNKTRELYSNANFIISLNNIRRSVNTNSSSHVNELLAVYY